MQNQSGRDERKRWLWLLIPCLTIALLQMTEYFLQRCGWEFRTNIQVIKGICIWTAAPALMVYGFRRLYPEEHSIRLCRVLMVFMCILILGISYARLGIYLYTGEYKTEMRTDEGLLICTDCVNSRQSIWEPVGILFRIPFQGWEETELLQRLKEQYGSDTRLEEALDDNTYLCRAASGRTGISPFYFRLKNDYWLTSNFESQLMASDASVFWRTRNRNASLYNGAEEVSLSGTDDINIRESEVYDKYMLSVYCGGGDDISVCAADLADWFIYSKEEIRYLKNGDITDDSPLTGIRIFGPEIFELNFNDLSQWLKEYSWAEIKEGIEGKLKNSYELFSASAQEIPEEDTELNEEEWAKAFMERYDGESCEKECAVGDNGVRYRMVCVDAALGSRAYALLKSTDGGSSWYVQAINPFDGQLGMGIDFTFLTEEYGFATLMHNGGDEADLYVTEDGGRSYHPSAFQGIGVELEDGYYYNPYDYPQMPYEEKGRLYVLCGQGMDGDYAGGDQAGMALFESTDHGYTFLYQGIRERD